MVIVALVLRSVIAGTEHAPDTAPVIDRESDWCDGGTITKTTGECICSSHLGFYCKETGDKKLCQSGYGISFFHWSCKECQCLHEKIPAGEWKERKNALKQSIRKKSSLMTKSAS